MKCLILASGQGSRLKTKAGLKPLVPLLGLRLIERVILIAHKAGLTEIYVVTGYKKKKLKEHLKQFGKDRDVSIKIIENDEWEKENGLSVLKAKNFIKENFVLLMCDHIFEVPILEKLKKQKIESTEIILAVDHNTKNNEFVDVEDATKVKVVGGKIKDIGKSLKNYNSYDTGIFLCSPTIFGAIEKSIKKGDTSLIGGIKEIARQGKARTMNIDGAFWIDVDNEKMLKKAERRLLTNLEKISDGPVSMYLNRHISNSISKYLAKTSISPNVISFFSFIIAMLGAFFFFLGGYVNLVVGAILIQLSSIVDGCDGEIARLKFQATKFGGWFDSVLDRYADAFILFGLIYHVYSVDSNFLYIAIGFLAIVGTFMNSYTADKYDTLMKKRLLSKDDFFRIGRDVRLLLIFFGALLNQVVLTLILIAVLTNAENIRRVVVLSYDRKIGLLGKED